MDRNNKEKFNCCMIYNLIKKQSINHIPDHVFVYIDEDRMWMTHKLTQIN